MGTSRAVTADTERSGVGGGGDLALALVAGSVVLLAVRLYAASHVGFGDSEALYASWAAHRQPAYLDHPGFIGIVARAIGEGSIPTPVRTHFVTSLVATLVPWLVVLVARAAGATARAAVTAGFAVALVPEIAIGLFALTPDFALAPTWLGAMGLAIFGLDAASLRSPRSATDAYGALRAAALLGAGLLAGIATSSKVSGLLLMISLGATYVRAAVTREGSFARSQARSPWPWAGLLAGAVVVVPIVHYEARLGWPMLHHRLVDTQAGAGIALQNIARLAGGQLAYLSPIFAYVAFVLARDLVRHRNDDLCAQLLFYTFAIPLAPLVVLCIWSPVAEPHWLAPPLLALPIHAARRASSGSVLVRRKVLLAGGALAAIFTALAHAWVLVPSSARLVPEGVDRRADIASELYGWPQAVEGVRSQMLLAATPFDPEGREVVVVGPHWTVCAQLHAALPGVRVGCATPIPDDFDRWLPRDAWRHAENVLWVTDNRFPGDGAEQLPELVRTAQSRVRVMRGGVTARVFDLYLYSRRDRAERIAPGSSHAER